MDKKDQRGARFTGGGGIRYADEAGSVSIVRLSLVSLCLV